MRNILLLICIVAFAGAATAQPNLNLRGAADFFGHVKTISSMTVTYENDGTLASFWRSGRSYSVYDRAGNEIESTTLDEKKTPLYRVAKAYDNEGKLSETSFHDSAGKIAGKQTFRYESGRLAEVLEYDNAGTLRFKSTKSYDSTGKLTLETYYDPVNAVSKTVFKYDQKGNWIESAYFLTDGTKEMANVGPCLGVHRIASIYDADGKLITREFFYPGGPRSRKLSWVHGENGTHSEYLVEGEYTTTKYTYKYEFDEKRNWIKRTAIGSSVLKETKNLKNPRPQITTTVTTREITYH